MGTQEEPNSFTLISGRVTDWLFDVAVARDLEEALGINSLTTFGFDDS